MTPRPSNPQSVADGQALRALAKDSGLILLYHGAWSTVPKSLQGGVHNVTPDAIHAQLELLKTTFTVVTVDEFAKAKDTRGLAAVSFDDGYTSVIDEALPVFEALDIPFTIYLNGASVNAEVFWRDKVRFIQEAGLADAFEQDMRNIDTQGRRFYRYTKAPENNSLHVISEIDRFLTQRNLKAEVERAHRYCIQGLDNLLNHPLVTYGNHSHSHYVMSSLTREQQHEEIERTAKMLDKLPGASSNLFSIPFGELRDFDASTVSVARECGYDGVLLSRAQPHRGDVICHGLAAFDRLMPRQESLLAAL